MPIILFIKAESFIEAKEAAQQRQIPIRELSKGGGNIGEFHALTGNTYARQVSRWYAEPAECLPGTGYPPGTLLFYRLTD
jgi:hypothetical protein